MGLKLRQMAPQPGSRGVSPFSRVGSTTRKRALPWVGLPACFWVGYSCLGQPRVTQGPPAEATEDGGDQSTLRGPTRGTNRRR
ncbi:hypothetical protein N2W54_002006 [Lotmaria passim]